MKTLIALIFTCITVLSPALRAADEMQGRDKQSRLDKPVYGSIEGALAVATQSKRAIFAIIYNPKNTKGMGSNDRILSFFADSEEVRTIIKSNFVQVFLSAASQSTKKLVPNTDEIVGPIIVILDSTGKIIAREKMSDGFGALAQVKKFVEINPSILRNQQVVDLLARFRRNKKN